MGWTDIRPVGMGVKPAFWLLLAGLWFSGCSLHERVPVGKQSLIKTGLPYIEGGITYTPLATARGYAAKGVASWYGPNFHGRRTANGELFDMYVASAAHTVLPLPTLVEVTNLENGRQITVRVNDRGPFVKNRLIDLSYEAAKQLGFVKQGTARVYVRVAPNNEQMLGLSERQAAGYAPQLFIQVGAFRDAAKAKQLVKRLKPLDKGRVQQVELDGAPIYRVRLGPFDHMQSVTEATHALERYGIRATEINNCPESSSS